MPMAIADIDSVPAICREAPLLFERAAMGQYLDRQRDVRRGAKRVHS